MSFLIEPIAIILGGLLAWAWLVRVNQ